MTKSPDLTQRLVNSLSDFIKVFYKIRTGRNFTFGSRPVGYSHFELVIKKLEEVFDGKCKRLIINISPRWGKTEMAIHFISWTIAQYPDSNHMYISYSHALAKKQTQTIREILQLKEYRELFNVKLKEGSQEKSAFETEQHGVTLGLGAQSSITGKGAGLKTNRYGGCIFIDDIIKPEDALSETIRESTNEWFYNTLISRTNSPDTPIIVIGQRTHEDDLCARLLASGGWEHVCIPAMDEVGNANYPEMHSIEFLKKLQQESPWVYAAQYAQDPVAGGSTLFKPDWFVQLDNEPKIISSFITCDTAISEKEWADYTVFSFWGLYQVEIKGNPIPDLYGLHWLDCWEERFEPKDLEPSFLEFYSQCMRHYSKPRLAGIENKVTGSTLISVLKSTPGLRIVPIERTKASGSKTARFLEMQPYVANKLISLPTEGKHTAKCIKHMSKITANQAHRFDDIADTLYDAVKMSLIDKVVINSTVSTTDYAQIGRSFVQNQRKLDNLRLKSYKS